MAATINTVALSAEKAAICLNKTGGKQPALPPAPLHRTMKNRQSIKFDLQKCVNNDIVCWLEIKGIQA
jgi:hypothetical protein